MKAKKLFALIAALLCLSMLFASCKKQPEEPIDTDAPTAPAPVEPGMETIFNLDWQMPAPEFNGYTKVSELNVESLPDWSYNIYANNYGSLIIYRDSSNQNVLRVYDYEAEKELIMLTDSDSYDGTNYTYVRNYLCIPSDKSIAVLTVTHKTTDQDSFYETSYITTSYFKAYKEQHEGSSYIFYDDYYYGSTTDYEIKVYNTADMTAPVKTVNSNTVKSWLNNYSFDNNFYTSVLKGMQLNVKYFNEGSYTQLASDLLLKDGNIYRVDKDGNMTLVRETGLNDVKTDGQLYIKSESYYYHRDINNKKVTVYDQNLLPVSTYSSPSYANDVNFCVMQNGNILVQYTVLLDENSETYDYILVSSNTYGVINQKYDLVTLVVSAADAKATEISANYKIVPGTYPTNSPFTPSNTHFISTYSTNPDKANYYNPEICNIATVNYIKDRRLDTSLVARDIVSVNNKGEIVKSLKLHDEWAGIPENLGNGYFSVMNVYGTTTVMDKTGKILSSNINYTQALDATPLNYRILSNGIYDMTGNKVYDLTDKTFTHTVLNSYKSTVLLKILSDNGIYKVILFNNGKTTELGVMDATGSYTTALGEGVTLVYENHANYGYVLGSYDATTGKYAYNHYNDEGTLLLTTESNIEFIGAPNGIPMYYGTKTVDNVTTTVIYKFS